MISPAIRFPGLVRFVLLTLFSLILFLLAGSIIQANAEPYQLIVNGGSGSGFYEPSTVVHISAFPYDSIDPGTSSTEPSDPSAPIRIFTGWTGNTASVNDVKAKDATLVMPARAITITAEFRNAARWKPPRMITSFPVNPEGVIYLFHGLESGIAKLVASLEITRFIDQALSRNFGVVMIESYDRKKGLWDVDNTDAEHNADMARLAEAHRRLVAKGTIPANTPVYLTGVSQGGFFATKVAAEARRGALPFTVRAVAVYICPGSRAALEDASTPTIFILARNDDVMDNGWALSDFDLLLDRGVASQLWMQEPAPVHPERFWGIPGLSQTDSQLLQSGLKANGMLDDQNFLLASAMEDGDGDGKADWVSALPSGYSEFLPEIGRQLRVAHASHAFFSNLDDKIFAFFENPTTIVNLVPVIKDFWPSSGSVGAVIAITGDNFVDIRSVTFNGIAVRYFNVSPRRLTVVVPYGATSGPTEITNSAGKATSPGNFTVTGGWIRSSDAPDMYRDPGWFTFTGGSLLSRFESQPD